MRNSLQRYGLTSRVGGFTLIEMLVVIALIAVLAGLLLPALSRAKEQGRRAQCTNNERMIGVALGIYCNNSNDYLPSYPGPGLPRCTYGDEGQVVSNWPYHQGASRHMVVGYSDANLPSTSLAAGRLNFMPVGLGILWEQGEIGDGGVLNCASAAGTHSTWYGTAEYQYDSSAIKKLGVKSIGGFVKGNGAALFHTPTQDVASTQVTAVLSSYSYRNTPFYCRTRPDNFPSSWNYDPSAGDACLLGGEWSLSRVDGTQIMPPQRAGFMRPAFPTRRQLNGRAIVSDSFDYASPSVAGTFSQGNGFAANCHGDGYNILYEDGRVKWYADKRIKNWAEWNDPANLGTDNLTISSPSSQKVWNLFDQFAEIDKP